MNIFAIIILFTLLLDYLLDLIQNLLNIKALQKTLPQEFQDTFDEDKYQKSQQYTLTNTKFSLIFTTINLIIILIFWFMGGFSFVDKFVTNLQQNYIVTGLAFIAILAGGNFIMSMPFNIYSTFVIEKKFGFNKTSIKTFVLDLVKSFFLIVILGAPILAGIIYFFKYSGEFAWLYCWITAVLFSLIVQFIAPTWIMPLFNKFTPLEEGNLKKAIFSFADKVNFNLKNIFVIDGSKRSTKSNAFFTGFGKNKRIALYDTLIEKHTASELVAILAHEIGHYKKRHILKGMIISILHMGAMFFILSIFITNQQLAQAFYIDTPKIYTGLVFFGMLFSPIEMVLSIIMQIFSRKHEFEADRFAAINTKDPNSMVNALKKLSSDNLSNLTPHPFYVFLSYSHPPVLKRIEAIKNIPQL